MAESGFGTLVSRGEGRLLGYSTVSTNGNPTANLIDECPKNTVDYKAIFRNAQV